MLPEVWQQVLDHPAPTIGERFGIPNIPNDKRFTGGVINTGINGFTSIGVQVKIQFTSRVACELGKRAARTGSLGWGV